MIKTALSALLAAALASTVAFAQPAREIPRSASDVQLSFAPLVRDTAPAVVNVYAERLVSSRSSMFDDPFFGRLFDEFFGAGPRQRQQNSLGSGVIVGADGVIVTNNHVVKGAQELRVVLSDRREFDAELVLSDERTDLAVLRIDPEGESLPRLPFAGRGELEVGDLVLAIGNPFGVGQTVTQGIVSALGRSDVGVSDYSFFIQTDAAINPGNSGGALIDVNGDLIGINTAIFSRSGGSNGIGFAIPSELVERVVEAAVSDGEIVRPWFSAKGQSVTSAIARSLGLTRPTGVLIADIYGDGPADKAGLREGDVVLSVDGAEVNDEAGLRFQLATRRIGERAQLKVWRDGRERTIRLRAEAPPESPARDERRLAGPHPLDGTKVVNLSPAFNDENDIDLFKDGVVLWTITRGSTADYFGFRPGDVILEINDEPVASTETLDGLLERYGGQTSWRIALERRGRRYEQTFRF